MPSLGRFFKHRVLGFVWNDHDADADVELLTLMRKNDKMPAKSSTMNSEIYFSIKGALLLDVSSITSSTA
jgi:hypothetical protein